MAATLFRQIGCLVTMKGAAEKEGRHIQESDLGILSKASLLVEEGRILWVGPHKDLSKNFAKKKIREVDARDKTFLPGFVECHTHLIFAGARAAEFEKRLNGVSYQQIAAEGGGILSSVRSTRAAKLSRLVAESQQKVNTFLSQGVTTLEIKSGYGLDHLSEIKCLQAIKKLKGPRIIPTFLGAHALPLEFISEREYLNFLKEKMLPEIKKKKLSKRVDIFVERGFFSVDQARDYLSHAQALGFDVTLHADQLSLFGGSDLGVQLRALSADHVIQIESAQIQNLAKSQTTAVLLPLADLYMKCAYPPARALIDAGARVALATDYNPGTCPSQDINTVGLLARLQMKMTLPEVLSAYTVGASWALGLQKEIGSIEVGKAADFVGTKVEWNELFYSAGSRDISEVYQAGQAQKNSAS